VRKRAAMTSYGGVGFRSVNVHMGLVRNEVDLVEITPLAFIRASHSLPCQLSQTVK
jgi:hypothetical protein